MKYLKIYGAIFLTMIFWSFSYIWFKMANENFKPFTIIFLRLLFAAVILTIFLLIRHEFVPIKREDRKLFLILSIFEPFLYFIGESNGLTYVTSTTGSVIISTIPVFVAIAVWIFFKQRLRIINYAGIILSFAGIVVFVVDTGGALTFNIKGLLFLGLAVFSATGYNILLERLVGKYNPVFVVNIQNIIGIILFSPIFLFTDMKNFFSTPHTLKSFVPILELAIFASCCAFVLFAWSVKQIGVVKVNPFSNFTPVLTAVFSYFLLGNTLTLQNIVGMIIIICGISLTQIDKHNKKTEETMILTNKSG
ncbi:MAG TPA: DMT family transporter [Bacteroidales bacterium]|nr:EamA family transporter [Bacteroidales bacterium]HOU96899.1 DMT family transporter [Bacteroidales bacterium]HQG36491.1 DMT family transporter [Bacteroidales bacterium]HQG52570.1 DMT family transporter [Bacteroidales bacterium]HRC89727.1 DMT family transporter [Bacteroidales bacterium]